MKIIIIGVVVLVVLLLVRFLAKKEFVIRGVSEQRLSEHLQVLLYRGLDGAFCVVTKRGRTPFIQLKKDIVSKGNVEVHITIPVVEWSNRFIDGIMQSAREHGFSYLQSEITRESPISFIDINIGMNTEDGSRLINQLFSDTFRADTGVKYKVRYSRISPHDVKIGF